MLYGYFLGTSCPVDKYYSLQLPRHTVIELIPSQYGWSAYALFRHSAESMPCDMFFRQEKRYDLSTDFDDDDDYDDREDAAVMAAAATSSPEGPVRIDPRAPVTGLSPSPAVTRGSLGNARTRTSSKGNLRSPAPIFHGVSFYGQE